MSLHPIDAAKDAALREVLFVHEHDLIGNLRRFPLITRYRLDRLQLVMPLDIWQRFSYEVREAMVLDAFDSDAARKALEEKIQDEARRVLGRALDKASPKPMADFRDVSEPPQSIVTALRPFDVELDAASWQSLPELARFGLAKLSREGHDNRRLGPLVDDLFFRQKTESGNRPL